MDLMQPIPFWKMNGAGNDFIVIDHRKPLIPVERLAEFARLVCRRKFSVGADGLFLLEPSQIADFRWRFFNADGSEAEMCGNGARCVARFAYMNGLAAARMRFETLAGIIDASVADTQVTIRMPAPHTLQLDLEIETAGRRMTGHSVNTGVPHLVVFVDDLVLNLEVLTEGCAAFDETTCRETGMDGCAVLANAETVARINRVGIWRE